MTGNSPEGACRTDAKLASAAALRTRDLVWSAQEKAVLAQLASALTRKEDLLQMYQDASAVKTKLPLSAEIRLLDRRRRGCCARSRPIFRSRIACGVPRRGRQRGLGGAAMPVDADYGAGRPLAVPGLHAVLRAREQKHFERHLAFVSATRSTATRTGAGS
jgi:hypothetical protein